MSMRLQELVMLMMLQLLLMIPMVLQLKSLTVLQLLLMTLMEPLLMRTILRLQLIMMTTMRLLELLTPMVLPLKNLMELQLRPLSMVMLPEEDAPDSTTDVQPHPEATEDQLQEPDLLPGDQLLRLRHKELEDSSTGDHRTPEDSNRQGEDVVEDSSPSPSLTEDQLETLLPSVCLLLNNLYRLNLFNHVALAFTILC